MMGLPYAAKIRLNRFDTTPKRDRRTDGQNSYINIARQHCCAEAR